MPNLIHEGVLILVPTPHKSELPPFCRDVISRPPESHAFQKYDQSLVKLRAAHVETATRGPLSMCGVREG
jgi:hypothetical protein